MQKENKIAIIIFLVAIVSGLFWNHRSYFQPPATGGDQWQYTCLAQSILEGGYSECGTDSTLEPLYPFFIASIFALFGENLEVVRFVQLFLFGVLSVLIYKFGLYIFPQDKRIGITAGFFSASTWYFANFTGEILREIVLILLTFLSVYSLVLAIDKKRFYYFAFFGFVFSLTNLVNGIVKYFIPFIILFIIIFLWNKIAKKQIILFLLITFFSFIITAIPWTLYKSNVNNKGNEFIASRNGFMLTMRVKFMEKLYPDLPKYYLGHTVGYYFVEKLYPHLDITAFRDFSEVNEMYHIYEQNGLNAIQIDEELFSFATNTILNQPHQYLALSGLDFIAFFNPIVPERIFGGNNYMYYTFAEGRHPQIPTFIKIVLLLGMRIFWYGLLTLAMIAFVQYRKIIPGTMWVFFIFILLHAAIHAAVHAIPRYGTRIYPLLFILAAAGFWYVYDRIKKATMSKEGLNK